MLTAWDGESLLSSQCAPGFSHPDVSLGSVSHLLPLDLSTTSLNFSYRPVEVFLLVEGYDSSGTTGGGETRSRGKQNPSLWTACHNMFHEQAGWLQQGLCGTYGATSHSEINTLRARKAANWRNGSNSHVYLPTLHSLSCLLCFHTSTHTAVVTYFGTLV